ncbi:hypothetical protein PybrP1_005909 [[Pythium] brassicae (nom. inval.)]|nr:hypothetical protein PybrP1_005909 [[Pythium] brassicae (nom. inval.)]
MKITMWCSAAALMPCICSGGGGEASSVVFDPAITDLASIPAHEHPPTAASAGLAPDYRSVSLDGDVDIGALLANMVRAVLNLLRLGTLFGCLHAWQPGS